LLDRTDAFIDGRTQAGTMNKDERMNKLAKGRGVSLPRGSAAAPSVLSQKYI